MPFNISEIDGVVPQNGRFPVNIENSPHDLGGESHIGQLIDEQIPVFIMRKTDHQSDPHTMAIDGRDISVDGSKLDTIETGAEVNNLSDQQAGSLTSGAHSSWHHHDDFYYRKSQLFLPGQSEVNWTNLIGVPTQFNPVPHTHDDRYYTESEVDGFLVSYYTSLQLDAGQLDNRYFTETEITTNYYTKTELDGGQLDNRYYTEIEIDGMVSNYYTKLELNSGQLNNLYYTESEINSIITNYYTKTQLDAGQLDNRYYTEPEIDVLITAATYGIEGSVDTFDLLPTLGPDTGIIYIVRQDSVGGEEGFYRWDGVGWTFLANNTGTSTHNELNGLNVGDYKHLTSSEHIGLTGGGNTSLHIHDDRYFTETEITANYYTKTQLDSGQLDSRYFTETEVSANFYTKTQLDGGQLNNLYYTELEVNNKLGDYYTKVELNGGQLNNLYYTETEIDSIVTGYYTKVQLDAGQLDNRYYTELEVDALFTASATGITGSVDVYSNLPITEEIGAIYIVQQNEGLNEEGFYRWDGTSWIFLANNTGTSTHNELTGLNTGDYIHLTSIEHIGLTSGVDTLLHKHNNLYYTESEIDGFLLNYYTSAQLAAGQLDTRYYTELEINNIVSNYYTKTDLDGGQLNNLYYTELEVDGFLVNYYTKTNLDMGQLDNRYYTESEVDGLLLNYYTSSQLDSGQLDNRYFTETEVTTSYYNKPEIDAIIAGIETFGIKGSVDTYAQLPVTETEGAIYIVRTTVGTDFEGFYKFESGLWVFLSRNTGNDVGIHNDLQGLNAGDYLHLTSAEYVDLTGGGSTILHNHNTQYYTKTETSGLLSQKSNVTHIHDDRYYTESETDGLLTGKSNTSHIHDERYYTESEVNGLLTTKSDAGHNHDDRYFTELEITSNYYSKNQLNTGQLDNRYYTESEINNFLNNKSDITHTHDDLYYEKSYIDSLASQYSLAGHIHDDRYYTEVEVDNLLAGKANTIHNHDDRYFTKTETGSTSGTSGAKRVGISLISGVTATNVQDALQEIKDQFSVSATSLDQAYNVGRTITADSGPVKIDSTAATSAPLELTNLASAPTTGLASGQLAIINNELYIFDISRNKWLTPSKILTFGRSGPVDGQLLYTTGGSSNNDSGYIMVRNGTITSFSLRSVDVVANKDVYIRLDGVIVYTLSSSISGDISDISLNIDFSAGSVLSIQSSSEGSNMRDVSVVVEFCWRK